MNKNVIVGMAVLLLSTLACEPVIAIGWREIFIVLGLIVFLLGPPLYRLIRRIENFLARQARKDK
jgi:hypothetical protein